MCYDPANDDVANMTDEEFIKELEELPGDLLPMTIQVYLCPRDEAHKTFFQRAVILEKWIVAPTGEYIDDVVSEDHIINHNVTCVTCGARAKQRDIPYNANE